MHTSFVLVEKPLPPSVHYGIVCASLFACQLMYSIGKGTSPLRFVAANSALINKH